MTLFVLIDFQYFIIAISTKLVFIIIIIWEVGSHFLIIPFFTINVWPDFFDASPNY